MSIHAIIRFLCLAAVSAALYGQTPAPRVAYAAFGSSNPRGWSVTPGLGKLAVSIPVDTVPAGAGEIPIPVAFNMNATYMTLSDGNGDEWNYGIYGTLGFGYVWPVTGIWSGFLPGNNVVLEDGRSYAATDFGTYSGSSPYATYGSALLAAYGVTCAPTQFMLSTDGSLVWAKIAGNQFSAGFLSKFVNTLPVGYPAATGVGTSNTLSGTNLHLLIDKNRIRVFAEVFTGTSVVALPVYWGDKFGHYVTFQWTRATTGLPAQILEMDRVDALNQRGMGVTVRWANWQDTTLIHDLLRADFVNCEAPSVLIQGYSGQAVNQPVGYSIWVDNDNPPDYYNGPCPLGGLVARPTTVTMGDPNTVQQPSWNNTGSYPATSPTLPSQNTGSASQVWAMTYDGNGAALTTILDPSAVLTQFSNQSYYFWSNLAFETPQLMLFGVGGVQQTDTTGRCPNPHTFLWGRDLASRCPGGISPWMVWAYDGWCSLPNGWNSIPESDRTATYTFAIPPSGCFTSVDYQNGFLNNLTLTDGTNTSVTTTTSINGGLDGTLSQPQTITTARTGEAARQVTLTYTDTTCLQAQTINNQLTTGASALAQAFVYNCMWPMLEGGQVNQVQMTRYVNGTALSPTAKTTKVWDTANLLQLQQTYLDAGSFQHGQTFTYSGGRLLTQGVWHVENGGTLASPATLTMYYDATTGQPSQWQTTYQDVPSGTGSISKYAAEFDGAGRPNALINERDVQTTLRYDLYGRPTSISKAGDAGITITYPDPWTKITTQANKTTTETTDGFGRLINQVLPDGRTVARTYDLHGRLSGITETNTSGVRRTSSTTYDALDRVTSQTAFDGVYTTFTYGTNGTLNTVTQTVQNMVPPLVTTTSKDFFGQLASVLAPSGDLTSYGYDGMGNRTSATITPAGQSASTAQVRSYFYDALGRMTSKNEPETFTQTYSIFNALNLATTITEGALSSYPRVRTLVFDGLGRLRSQSNGAVTESFTYTGAFLNGTSRTVGSDQVAQTFTYGGLGARLSQETTTSNVTGAW